MILQMTDVSFRWPGRPAFSMSVPSFAMTQGETVLLLGESGSGKSTFLSLISGTVQADQGEIFVAGANMTALSRGTRDRVRAENIGVIFQQFNLLPFGSVADNIMLPLQFARGRRKRAGHARKTAARLCADLGLPATLMTAKARSLSVGQQQRVAVARALIGQPPLIIADEPTSALDSTNAAAFLDLLFQHCATNQTALLMVSHDPALARRFDRVVQMDDIAQTEPAAA